MRHFELTEGPDGTTLTARGRTWEELFRHAALGASALVADPETVAAGGLRDRLRVRAPDAGKLLELWLQEVLAQFSANRLLIAGIPSISVKRDRGWALEAVVDGELADPGRHALRRPPKPGPFREVAVEEAPDGLRARVVLDA